MAITSIDDFSPIFVGDSLKPFAPQIWTKDATGNYVPQPLSGFTLTLSIIDSSYKLIDTIIMTIDDATNGKAHCTIPSIDTSVPGTYMFFVKMTDGTGKFQRCDVKTLVVQYAP